MGVVWPIVSWPSGILDKHRTLYVCWAVACVFTGIFPLLGVEKKESLSAMYVLIWFQRLSRRLKSLQIIWWSWYGLG